MVRDRAQTDATEGVEEAFTPSPRRRSHFARGFSGLGGPQIQKNVRGWRIAEVQLAFKEFDRKGKGFLNSSELRRLLIAFGVKWSIVKKVVQTNQYWTFEAVLAAVEKLQPCTGISDTTYSTLQTADRKLNGKSVGMVDLQNLISKFKEHGLDDDDIYILLFKYIDTKDQLLDRVTDFSDKGFSEKHFDLLQQGHIKQLNLSDLTKCKGAKLKYGDLHRELFPAVGWEGGKYWHQFEELELEVDEGYGSMREPTSVTVRAVPKGWD
jgi:Ca2+-binding EF-hand superfamily protein